MRYANDKLFSGKLLGLARFQILIDTDYILLLAYMNALGKTLITFDIFHFKLKNQVPILSFFAIIVKIYHAEQRNSCKMKQNISEKFRRGSGDEIPSEIPGRYEIDTIRIMPINVNSSFIYWEITEMLLNRKLRQLNIDSANLMIRILGTGRQKKIYSFNVNEMIGNHHINYHPPSKYLTAEVGIIKNGKFTGLLKSKTVSTPYVENRDADDEIWMKKTEDICKIVNIAKSETRIAKEREFLEYCQETASLQESPSSGSVLPVFPSG